MSTVRSKLLLSAAALAALAAAAPARAAVPDPELVIEGPIDGVDATAKTITIMGIPIVVTSGTFDTPTKTGIPLAEMLTPLPGRRDGFVGGPAMATGGSTAGKVTASKLFSDANENVVVGEVTSAPGTPLTVNFLP